MYSYIAFLRKFIKFYLRSISITKKNKPLIYCSLGSISAVHYKYGEKFFKKVIHAFRDRKDYIVVLAVGQSIQIKDLGELPNHIYAFQKVPQIELLKNTDAMITHGGANTILECILLGVPMLAYPLNNIWDQNGYSARMVYHGLGLSGIIKKANQKEIFEKVKKILSEPHFKYNMLKMRALISTDNDFSMIDEIIKQY